MTVYRLAEDTYLVLNYIDGLELSGKKVLDIGTGNGEIALKAAEKDAEVTAVDINPEALEYAQGKAEERGLQDRITFLESDLFEKVKGKFDLVVFNPPYLPGEKGLGDEEIWRGGKTGLEVSRRFLDGVGDFLLEDGYALLVASSLSGYGELVDGYGLSEVDSEELWFERLSLLKFG
ncbi:MAG: HemK2/MTQ2 family protein methyltransferase [Candidatus Nanohalobium sp.]